jgi:hypothetical protein
LAPDCLPIDSESIYLGFEKNRLSNPKRKSGAYCGAQKDLKNLLRKKNGQTKENSGSPSDGVTRLWGQWIESDSHKF